MKFLGRTAVISRSLDRGVKTAISAFLSIFLVLALPRARADWRLGAETGAGFDSNLSNSDRGSDERSDLAWKTGARIGNGFQLSRDLRLNIGADLRSFVWGRFDAFDEIGAGLFAAVRYRFGLGAQAPWILLEERIGYDGFREASLDRWDEALQLRGGLALSPRVALEAGYTFQNLAGPGDFFDRQATVPMVA